MYIVSFPFLFLPCMTHPHRYHVVHAIPRRDDVWSWSTMYRPTYSEMASLMSYSLHTIVWVFIHTLSTCRDCLSCHDILRNCVITAVADARPSNHPHPFLSVSIDSTVDPRHANLPRFASPCAKTRFFLGFPTDFNTLSLPEFHWV